MFRRASVALCGIRRATGALRRRKALADAADDRAPHDRAVYDAALPDRDVGGHASGRARLTLSCDHRSIDGATASEFLRSVKEFLEEPGLML